jgi:hypothetical protein
LEVGPTALALTVGHKAGICGAGTADCGSKPAEHLLRVLPEVLARSKKRSVSAPRILAKRSEIGDCRRAEGVQVDVADQLEEIGLFLDDDGLVAILKEMPGAAMPPVECARISGKEASHAAGERAPARPEEEVRVVREESPGVNPQGAHTDEGREAREEILPIPIVSEDDLAVKSADDDVVERSGCVETRSARHGEGSIAESDNSGNVP